MATSRPQKKHNVRVDAFEWREVLRALCFIQAAELGAPNTFYVDHPNHGVTDAQNVILSFLERHVGDASWRDVPSDDSDDA